MPVGSTAGIVTGRFCAGVFAASVPLRRRQLEPRLGRCLFTVAGCEQVPVAQAAATDIVSGFSADCHCEEAPFTACCCEQVSGPQTARALSRVSAANQANEI